jgi:hypothetical protein
MLEDTTGYEPALIESVLRKLVELDITMINRLINGGTSGVEGRSLVSLLRAIAASDAASGGVRELATKCVEYQKRPGRAEA